MILHIFRKDWKLLWRFFLVFVGVEFIPAFLRMKNGAFPSSSQLAFLEFPSTVVAMAAIVFMAIAIMHQDAIPGMTQDWLVRPIKRMDLLLAKLLFVALMQGAIFAADFTQISGSGFSFAQALAGASAHNIYFGVMLTLPALCIAAVTRNIMEAIAGSALAFLVWMCVDATAVFLHGGASFLRRPSATGGTEWIGNYVGQSFLIAGVVLVLGMQYRKRETRTSRWIIGATTAVFVVAQFLPWSVTFAAQQHLSPNLAASEPIALTADAPQADPAPQLQPNATPDSIHLLVPLKITGVPDSGVVKSDRSEIALLTPDGHVLYRTEGDSWIHVGKAGSDVVMQGFNIPEKILRGVSNHPVVLTTDHSLTLLSLKDRYRMPAIDGKAGNEDIGHCATSTARLGTAIVVRCDRPSTGVQCINTYIEEPGTANRIQSMPGWCTPDYAPGLERYNRNPMASWGNTFFFHDPMSGDTFPTDKVSLSQAKAVMEVFEVQSHFQRKTQLALPALQTR